MQQRITQYVSTEELCATTATEEEHPLLRELFEIVQSAMRDVRETQLGEKRLVDTVSSMHGNIGSMIGTLFEHFLAQHLPSNFGPQQKKLDADFVCRSNSAFDFEVKTTSSRSKNIFGNRIAATTEKKGSYLLAVQYEMATLEVVRVRFGWIEPSDWVAQKGNGQQSHLSLAARQRLQVL
jgi:hypothetical protein